jgi:phosphoribosylamine--glycine ligase
MKILVIGSGGREHALVWKISRDSRRPDIFCAPGNPGTAQLATNIPIAAEDVPALVAWAKKNRPDLTIVGPEAPLCAGIVDALNAEGLRAFGPCKAAAQMEGSKAFAKDVLNAANAPTAKAQKFSSAKAALDALDTCPFPLVVKADGLAAGKGVIIAGDYLEAVAAVYEIMEAKQFGAAGETILLEEFLEGEEASILALVDGEHIKFLPSSQDHKRVFDNDEGPNTGGMGAYSPAPVVTDEMWPRFRAEIFEPVLRELKRRGIIYKGLLYAGLMMTKDGPKVIEFNARFGDPETQVVLPRVENDLIPLFEACIDGTLDQHEIKISPDAACTVVMAAPIPATTKKALRFRAWKRRQRCRIQKYFMRELRSMSREKLSLTAVGFWA